MEFPRDISNDDADEFVELLHQHTKLVPLLDLVVRPGLPKGFMRRASTGQKVYRYHAEVQLPRGPLGPVTVQSAIQFRRSASDFGPDPLTLVQLGQLLQHSAGITGSQVMKDEEGEFALNLRAYPSGGALFPLELYLLALNVEGLGRGLYHYNVVRHSLETLMTDAGATFQEDVRGLFADPDLPSKCGAVLFVSAVMRRSMTKYGKIGYRLILLEAGHLGQNFCLVGAALGVGVRPWRGYWDDVVHRFLRIDGVREALVHSILIGSPATSYAPPSDG